MVFLLSKYNKNEGVLRGGNFYAREFGFKQKAFKKGV